MENFRENDIFRKKPLTVLITYLPQLIIFQLPQLRTDDFEKRLRSLDMCPNRVLLEWFIKLSLNFSWFKILCELMKIEEGVENTEHFNQPNIISGSFLNFAGITSRYSLRVEELIHEPSDSAFANSYHARDGETWQT